MVAFRDVASFLEGACPELLADPWGVPLVAFLVLVVPSCEDEEVVVAFLAGAFLAFLVGAFPVSYSLGAE